MGCFNFVLSLCFLISYILCYFCSPLYQIPPHPFFPTEQIWSEGSLHCPWSRENMCWEHWAVCRTSCHGACKLVISVFIDLSFHQCNEMLCYTALHFHQFSSPVWCSWELQRRAWKMYAPTEVIYKHDIMTICFKNPNSRILRLEQFVAVIWSGYSRPRLCLALPGRRPDLLGSQEPLRAFFPLYQTSR